MRPALLACIFASLIACSSDNKPIQVDNVMAIESSWQDLASSRHAAYLARINADKQVPASHSQLARAVASLIDQCARRSRNGRSWATIEKMSDDFTQQEIICAKDLINETLVISGADRAHEASLAAKSSNPAWFVPIMPTYVMVD